MGEFREKPEATGSPTLDAILNQKTEIKFVGEEGGSVHKRTINGDEWLGKDYTYSIRIPQDGKEDWVTELRVWAPTNLTRKFWKPLPSQQLYIATGKGEMEFTSDDEHKYAVIAEINRQLQETEEKEKK